MCLKLAMLLCACAFVLPRCIHAQIAIDSFDGPVTQNEINSFKSYILTLKPATWDGSSGNTTGNMANEYAQGHSGENIKAMGLMYEISGDTAILDRMIYFCDVLLSQRNDILPAPHGQTVFWTGTIAPAWDNAANAGDPSSASGDGAGHLANCARLILQTPAIWNTTVPVGDPFGHGATYLDRAKTFVKQADISFDDFFFRYELDLSDQNHLKYCSSCPYQPGNQLPWNQEMMFTYPLQNLAAAHSILGDDPTRVAKYDNIVQVNLSRFFNDTAVRLIYTDSAGNTAYNWGYTPFYQTGEDSNHGSLDIAGFSRAYTSGRYRITSAMMTPFANTFVDVMTLGPGNYGGRVDGSCGTGHAACTTYIRSGYLLLAEFRPDAYQSMMAADFTAPGTTTSMDGFSRFEWVKNRRAQGSGDFSLSASPSSQTVTAGGSTSYTGNVSPSNGFNSSVNLSVSGAPSGATGSFNPTSISGGSGSSTLSVGTALSTPAGTYTLTATGTSGTLTHNATVTLVVNPPPQVAAPTFNPVGGSFTAAQSVTISTSTSGASIRYTTDGSTPSETAGTLYSGPVTVSSTTTLKAIAYESGMSDSAVSSATYTISLPQVATPTFNPAGGSFTAAQSVTISTTTSGASIRYTTDGSTPSETAGTLYSGPVAISSTTTLKAIAYESGMSDSVVSSATYTINLPQVAAPTFNPAGGSYSAAQSVTISTTTSGASIRYTTDGSTPSETAGTLYSGPVTIGSATTLKAIAYESGMSDSSVSSATYTISLPQVAAPTFSPAGGSYSAVQSVTISTTASGASIRYTTDGSTPSETAGTLYSGPVTVSSTTTLKAIAYESGMVDSPVGSATYTITITGLPNGWSDSDIGSPSLAGSATFSNNTFTIKGNGADIYGTSDQFNYTFMSASGDLTVTARVASQTNTHAWAKSGVMIRETTAANAAYVGIYVTTSNGIDMQYRSTTGASATDLARASGIVAPYWVRLVRAGNTFTGYRSADGVTWTQVGSISATMASGVTAGLAVCSHNTAALSTSTFDNVSISTPAPDFSLSASPASQTVTAGGTTSYTATTSAFNGFSGSVALSVSGLPAGASGSFNPTSVSGSGSSTLSVVTTSSTQPGTYTLTLTGASGSLSHSATVALTVNVPDFSISATPGSQFVTVGAGTSYTATVSPLNGFNGTVNLGVSGLPSGATGGFSPASIGGSGSSTLSISTSSTTPTGTYTLTITGTSTSLSHSTTVSLTVNSSSGLPTGWSDSDVGTPSLAGSATLSSGVFTIQGGGADIWGTSDNFNYASGSVSGDVTITARLASQQNTNVWAKAGVMLRETTAADAAYAFVMVTPGKGVAMQYRPSTGASAVNLAETAGPIAPYWVQLVRSGSTFTGYTSSDGVIWTQLGTISIGMAGSIQAGLAVTSHDDTQLNASTFDNVSTQ
jgi:regulation of enolase protein 1 (concanavalin A-like superfamily)